MLSVKSFRIIERVAPRLNHMNPAIVLSAIKVILRFVGYVQKESVVEGILKKLTPPLGKASGVAVVN